MSECARHASRPNSPWILDKTRLSSHYGKKTQEIHQGPWSHTIVSHCYHRFPLFQNFNSKFQRNQPPSHFPVLPESGVVTRLLTAATARDFQIAAASHLDIGLAHRCRIPDVPDISAVTRLHFGGCAAGLMPDLRLPTTKRILVF